MREIIGPDNAAKAARLDFELIRSSTRSLQSAAPSAAWLIFFSLGVMRNTLIFVVVLTLKTIWAQDPPMLGQLSPWAEQAWSKLVAKTPVRLSTRLNPFVWRGDFDGNGRPDLAVLIAETKTKKEGIAFLLQGRAPVVVGAGQDFGNGGDDFSWMDVWHVEDRGTGHGNSRDQNLTLKADGLMVAKEGSASALIYFRNGKPVWHQSGD